MAFELSRASAQVQNLTRLSSLLKHQCGQHAIKSPIFRTLQVVPIHWRVHHILPAKTADDSVKLSGQSSSQDTSSDDPQFFEWMRDQHSRMESRLHAT
jgi:hypothetical protein